MMNANRVLLLPCCHRNGRWGYISEDGEWIISPRFAHADPFCEGGTAAVLCDRQLHLWTLIDQTGSALFVPQRLDLMVALSEDRALAENQNPFVMDGSGCPFWRPVCSDLQPAGNGLYVVWNGSRGNSWGSGLLVREGGETVVSEPFQEVQMFPDGRRFLGRREYGYVVMDLDGRVLHRFDRGYDRIDAFDEMGRAVFSRDGRCGVMREDETFLVDPQFLEIDFCFGHWGTCVSFRNDPDGDFQIYNAVGGSVLDDSFEYTAPAVEQDMFWGEKNGGWSLYRVNGDCLAHDICTELLPQIDGRYQGVIGDDGEMFYVDAADGAGIRIVTVRN